MLRVDVHARLLTGIVVRSDRHRTANFELDCTAPPGAPASVQAKVEPAGVMLHWVLERDTQVATSYLVEVDGVAGSKDRAVTPVPRGVDRVTLPLPSGPVLVRVRAQNYCGTSPPSDELRVTVP
jgi:hypothetical protein